MERAFASNASPDGLRLFSHADAAQNYRLRTLLVLVILQCVLYGINLKILPMWGDETFTVETVAETPARIIEIVREDIHPPLYFLLAHWWNRIPIGHDPLLRLRALSAFAILTTVFIDRWWLRYAPQNLRTWFLLLWASSRLVCCCTAGMARSCGVQLGGGSDLVSDALRGRNAAGWKNLAAFVAALEALLYTHTCRVSPSGQERICCCWRKAATWRSIWKTWLLPNALVAVLYLPWLVTLSGALGQWQRQDQVYSLTGNLWAGQVLKLAYWFYSFTFGEAIPLWLLPVTVVLASALPVAVGLRGTIAARDRLWPALFAAAVAYRLGATRWVSYPFMGAAPAVPVAPVSVTVAAGG